MSRVPSKLYTIKLTKKGIDVIEKHKDDEPNEKLMRAANRYKTCSDDIKWPDKFIDDALKAMIEVESGLATPYVKRKARE